MDRRLISLFAIVAISYVAREHRPEIQEAFNRFQVFFARILRNTAHDITRNVAETSVLITHFRQVRLDRLNIVQSLEVAAARTIATREVIRPGEVFTADMILIHLAFRRAMLDGADMRQGFIRAIVTHINLLEQVAEIGAPHNNIPEPVLLPPQNNQPRN